MWCSGCKLVLVVECSSMTGCSGCKLVLVVECSSMTGPMTDIITGNPMVVKMIVSFNRSVWCSTSV